MRVSTPLLSTRSLYSIDLYKSKRLLREYAAEYNEHRPLREQLRANHLALLTELLDIYRIALWRRQQEGNKLLPGLPLPYLKTNNAQLSQVLCCSKRSIQHLRQRLKCARLILDEVWHGTRAAYEVKISPAILYLSRAGEATNQVAVFEPVADQAIEDTSRTASTMWKSSGHRPAESATPALTPAVYSEISTAHSANFSSYCTQSIPINNQLNQLEVGSCGQVLDTLPLPDPAIQRGQETGYETISDKDHTPPRVARRPPNCSGPVFGRAASPSGQARPIPSRFSAVVQHLPDKQGRAIFREVKQVWELARQELYADSWLADSEIARAKARLAEYYIDALPRNYRKGTREICERIRLVRKWLDRGRRQGIERWVPLPSIYFDHRNPRGFRRTKSWYKNHRRNRGAINDEIALSKAVRRYRRCLASQSTQSPLELFNQLSGQLAGRDPQLADRFKSLLPALPKPLGVKYNSFHPPRPFSRAEGKSLGYE